MSGIKINGFSGFENASVGSPISSFGVSQMTNEKVNFGNYDSNKAVPFMNPTVNPNRDSEFSCKPLGINVLRPPPYNASNAYQAVQGIGRNQPAGIGGVGRNINTRPMPPSKAFM
jgi:hypothetical protein